MSPVLDVAWTSVAGDVNAIVERASARPLSTWQRAMLGSPCAGSAGVIEIVPGYGLYLPHVGTSPMVFDSRGTARSSQAPAPAPAAAREPVRTPRHTVLRMSSADQALEVLAALSLNKTLLAEVLGVSRPTLYDWLEGKEPNTANAQRLRSLTRLLGEASVTAANALSPRFVREALNDGDPSLLDLLKANTLDEARIRKVLAEAKALEDDAEAGQLAREARLRALGYELPTDDERRHNLALNVARREWPND